MFRAPSPRVPAAAVAVAVLFAAQLHAQFADPAWRYTTERPPAGWHAAGFDDSRWQLGKGGFGDPGTPGSRIQTEWFGDDIWLRRVVALAPLPQHPALLVYHDEDAEVFVNGTQVAMFTGYVTAYRVVPLDEAAKRALVAGDNLLAVHCHQTGGGQGIDVHLIDADDVPKLPPPARPEHPYRSDLVTPWGEVVTAANAWREYPRPQLVRAAWQDLNGEWDYAITPLHAGRPREWQGRIVVPFCVESRLSGVQRLLHEDQALWYHRTLPAAPAAGPARTLLHFEACDYRTKAWIGDTEVGEHVGGNTPFSFDVTEALAAAGGGAVHLYVRVEDATGGYQLRGKQVPRPGGIWYTPVSGIWGTVWTERVPARYVERLTIATKIDGTVTVTVHGDAAEATAVARRDGVEVARATGAGPLTLHVHAPELWSPDAPTLYDLEVTAGDDSVRSYFGIREVGRAKDAAGHWRLLLNGAPIFHWGPLDQGWWPDGLLTPPSDAAMRWDVDFLKAAGFNMIRKHIKVEPRRYYAWCDRVGMMIWQDQVAAGHGPRWTHLRPDPEDARWPDDAKTQFLAEFDAMITTLENHPSVVVWVPFNEAWGQHDTVAVGEWTRQRDPSRLVDIASGGNFWPTGDICDEHSYPHPSFPFELGAGGRFDAFALVVGEFGGHGLPVPGHLWREQARSWGYGGLPKDDAEYVGRYEESLRRLRVLIDRGICGAVYTQTTDVEIEINGLVTYDRKHVKIPAAKLREMHAALLAH
ncbi:MAG TPA: glycoside hydrolase family 2 TIM barrel-domain containing protein [Planctomycetota bacterium]|nr:glycoside hydrolase family 2 TIM barrel-domain containing protein [Planctomycetota bacterium]